MITILKKIMGSMSRNGAQVSGAVPAQEEIQRRARQQVARAVETRLKNRRTLSERFTDALVAMFGTLTGAVAHVLIFTAWIITNLGFFPVSAFLIRSHLHF